MSPWAALIGLIVVLLGTILPIVAETGVGGSSSRKDPPRVQLAFGVMTYQREDRTVEETYAEFLRLMVNIYESEDRHVYVLHTDVKSDPALLRAINEEYCAPKANCRHIPARNIAWGSITTGEMMLALMRKADGFFNDGRSNVTAGHAWDYFILLGHESFPLTSLRYAENFLASFPR